MPPPPYHPYLNRLDFKSIPDNRTNHLIKVGSEEFLFNIAIAAAEAKTVLFGGLCRNGHAYNYRLGIVDDDNTSLVDKAKLQHVRL